MEFPTRDDLFRDARNRILSLNAQLSTEVVTRDGTDANVLVAAMSGMADAVVGQLMLVCAGQFLDSAESEALDRYVFDRYGMLRKPASPSYGTAAFSTVTAVTDAFTIPAGTSLTTSDGVAFFTTAAASMQAGTVGPVYVAVRSVLAGIDQQAKIGSIVNITGSVPGAPGDLRVTNNTATAGAADVEDDAGLRDRARRFWTTSQRGTLAAIELGGLSVPGVVTASALEIVDGFGRPGRWVQLLVADRFTDALVALNQTSVAYQTQSQTLAVTVFNALNAYRCAGIYVQVIVARVVLLQVRLDLTFSASIDPAQVSDQARAAVVNYTNGLAPGAPFVPAQAIDALRGVDGLIITGNEIAVPTGTVLPRAQQAIRSTFALVLATNQGLPLTTTADPDIIS